MNPSAALHAPPAPALDAELDAAIESACRHIAPSWPLDRQIAVNPFWGLVDRPFPEVAATMRRLAAARFALPVADYGAAWRSGAITDAALARALAESGTWATREGAIAVLDDAETPAAALPLLSDIVDRRAGEHAGPRWRDTITQQVSQFCASCFDELQADWHRSRSVGLFAGWREVMRVDHALEPLMHAPEIRARMRDIPGDPRAAIAAALTTLGVPPAEAATLLQVCLLRINGWASWCAYLRWEARLSGGDDTSIEELLAIRVCWEALLHDRRHDRDSAWQQWRDAWTTVTTQVESPAEQYPLVWQRAQEISYQDRLIAQLRRPGAHTAATPDGPRPAAQLVFCIDVRSERFRRALEAVDSAIETRGFAGFFGLPIRYQPIGVTTARPQLPGLLAPRLTVSDTTGHAERDREFGARRATRLAAAQARQPFQRTPSGTFSLVESAGVAFSAALLRGHFGAASARVDQLGLAPAERRALQPRLHPEHDADGDARADLAASVLRAMSLTSGFSRLLVLVGHGSQSANNPQAAALDCGACGGQTGEINARVLAALLNDTRIRALLRERGIVVPDDTVAIGALHNTTTDEVELFDVERLPASHAPELERLQRQLVEAGHRTRAERAPALGLAAARAKPDALLRAIRRRARDWAETRPEWGLADNAAFVVAPRGRTRGLELAGRCFLHDYTWTEDHDGKVLELIMTAPMIVTHWINLQYYASTVDPERFGSGNKTLHNVVGARIGVFEGNSGDLRVGLSLQSVHDGERWMHTPLRLSVFIDAPRAMIDAVLAAHAGVRQLVAQRWLYLFRFADEGIEQQRDGRWDPWVGSDTAAGHAPRD